MEIHYSHYFSALVPFVAFFVPQVFDKKRWTKNENTLVICQRGVKMHSFNGVLDTDGDDEN